MLEVAKQMIAEGGSEGFTIRELGRKARVSVTTIYATYGDKEGMIAAAIEDFYQRLPLANRPAPSNLQGLLAALDEATAAALANPPYAHHYVDLYLSPTIDPRIHRAIRDTSIASVGYVPWLQRVSRDGDILPGIDVDRLPNTITAHALLVLREWAQGRIAAQQVPTAARIAFLTLLRGVTQGPTHKKVEAALKKSLRAAAAE